MLNNKNLNKMYCKIIDGEILTISKLKECGFEIKDIYNLIEKGYLIKKDNEEFILKDVKDLYYYGFRLVKTDEQRAKECFEKCYQLDPNHEDTSMQFFYQNIVNKDYKQAFKYLDIMMQTSDDTKIKDNNFYLYLLSTITDIPDKYSNIVKNITFKDIEIDENNLRYTNIAALNQVRLLALERKFFRAKTVLKETTNTTNSFTFYDKMIKSLLTQADNQEKNNRNKVAMLVKYKKYEEILKYYEEKYKNFNLIPLDASIIKVVEEILNIKRTLTVPERTVVTTKNLFEAIDAKSYMHALKLSDYYVKKLNSGNVSINILLTDLCELINKTSSFTTIFNIIIKYVKNKDYTSSIKTIKNYLYTYGMSQYESLVIDHIKLAILENDEEFKKLKFMLYEMYNNEYEFNSNKYIEAYYANYNNKKYNIASIYLDIILKYASKEEIEKLKLDTVNNSSKDILKFKTYKLDRKEKYIDNIYEKLLKEKGIVLLPEMDWKHRQEIYEIVKKYPNMAALSIGKEPNRRIFLRYKAKNEEVVDFTRLIKLAEEAYDQKEYDICISYYLQLNQYGTPKASIYAKIALCYLKLGYELEARDYFIVATQLSNEADNKYDFTNIIDNIDNKNTFNKIKTLIKKVVLK